MKIPESVRQRLQVARTGGGTLGLLGFHEVVDVDCSDATKRTDARPGMFTQ